MNHWQIALNSVCVVPPKLRNGGYTHSYKWVKTEVRKEHSKPVEKLSDTVRRYLEEGKTIEQVVECTGIPAYYIRRVLTRKSKVLDIPALDPEYNKNEIITLHLAEMRNQDIAIKLGKSKQHVSQVIKRYKAKEKENAS